LEKTVNKKPNSATPLVGPEVERAVELVRSGLRAALVVNRLEDIALNRRWQDFMERLSKSPATSGLIEALVSQERGSSL
jgi:hypothetical protein